MKLHLTIIVLFLSVNIFAQTDSAFRVKDFANAKVTYTKASVPKPVVDKINELSNFNGIADSGEAYNAGDVALQGRKWSKLFYFVTTDKYYIMVYHTGGFVSSQTILLFYRIRNKIGDVRTIKPGDDKWIHSFDELKEIFITHDFSSYLWK